MRCNDRSFTSGGTQLTRTECTECELDWTCNGSSFFMEPDNFAIVQAQEEAKNDEMFTIIGIVGALVAVLILVVVIVVVLKKRKKARQQRKAIDPQSRIASMSDSSPKYLQKQPPGMVKKPSKRSKIVPMLNSDAPADGDWGESSLSRMSSRNGRLQRGISSRNPQSDLLDMTVSRVHVPSLETRENRDTRRRRKGRRRRRSQADTQKADAEVEPKQDESVLQTQSHTITL